MCNYVIYLIYQFGRKVIIMKDCSKCHNKDWCSSEEMDKLKCPVKDGDDNA